MPTANNADQNLFNLLTENADDDDLTLQVINNIFDNMDKEDISRYHDVTSYNSILTNNSESLSFLHLNMRSLVKKINCTDALINSFHSKPDVIAISESWLKPKNSKFYKIDGYTSYNLTRPTKKGGGVSLLVKTHLTSELIENFSYITGDIEICTINLKVNCKSSNKLKIILFVAFIGHTASLKMLEISRIF